MRAVAAKVQEATYDRILYEAAKHEVTVSVVVRRALERAFGPNAGNLKESTQERVR
jgi:hypothetical protein